MVGDGRCAIYAIYDPRNGNVRYVGKCTMTCDGRWGIHRNELKRNAHSNPRLQYLHNKLQRLGLGNLSCRPLEYCEREELSVLESWWIAKAERSGMDLCNAVEGGGVLGKPCSEETKRKISKAKLGKPNVFSPEGMKSFIAKQKARIPTEKQLAALERGRTDPEIVAKMKAAVVEAAHKRKGRKVSEERRTQIRQVAQMQCKLTEEVVKEIRQEYWSATNKVGIVKGHAIKYKVSHTTILNAIMGRTWRNIPMPSQAGMVCS